MEAATRRVAIDLDVLDDVSRAQGGTSITLRVALLISAGVVGFLTTAIFGVNRRGGVALVLASVGIFVAFYIGAYIGAAHAPNPSECEGCRRYLGRYWDPGFVGILAAVAEVLAAACAAVGVIVWLCRGRLRRSEH
jgi:hypothetical protein